MTTDNKSNNDGVKSFKYLDELIHSGQKEVTLEYDIILAENEDELYPEGIMVDVYDFVIDGNGHTIDAQSKTRIFKIAERCNIKNLQFINGYSKTTGGSITVKTGNPCTIKNCYFENNKAHIGATIHTRGSKIIIEDSEFTNNTSDYAILSFSEENIYIYDSSFSNNKTTDKVFGGTLSFSGVNEATLNNIIMDNNKSESIGGGIQNIDSVLKIENSKLSENTALLEGGAIFNFRGNITISNTFFTKNRTEKQQEMGEMDCTYGMELLTDEQIYEEYVVFDNGGGAISNYMGSITIINSKLDENYSANNGGAIYNKDGTTTLIDNSLKDNQARTGSILYNRRGTINISENYIQIKGKPLTWPIYNCKGILTIANTKFKYINNEFINICKNYKSIGFIKVINSYVNSKKIEN